MEPLTQQVTKLRDSLLGADARVSDSFSKVFDTFFDIVRDTPLMEASKRFQDRRVRLLLDNLARAHTRDPKVTLSHVQMFRHAPSGLVHGMFFAAEQPATFFYFLQEQQGLVALVGPYPTTHYYRMTVAELPATTDPNELS